MRRTTLALVLTCTGADPGAVCRTTKGSLPALVAAIGKPGAVAGGRALADRLVIRRASTAFRPATDAVLGTCARWVPRDASPFKANRRVKR